MERKEEKERQKHKERKKGNSLNCHDSIFNVKIKS